MSASRLVVRIGDAALADGVRGAVDAVVGVETSLRSGDGRTTLVLLATHPGVTLPDSAAICLSTEKDEAGVRRVTIASDPPLGRNDESTAALATVTTEADAMDVARLLGAILRGQIPWEQFDAHLERYRSLQLLSTELADGNGSTETLERALPWLMTALRSDLGDRPALDRWGVSTTVEDDQSLLPAAIIDVLAEHPGVPSDVERCHAGLAHTYGYLLSSTATTYGRKRHRWTSLEAAHALGLAAPWPFESDAGILRAVTSVLSVVAPLDGHTPLPLDDGIHSVMSVRWERTDIGTEASNHWRARTRVLQRVGPTDEDTERGDELLLVYSVAVDDGPERYITAFPVSSSFGHGIVHAEPKGLRFNAVA